MLNSRSAYGKDKKHTSDNKTTEFKYPVVLYVLKNTLSFIFSNTKENGHFNQPKIILHPYTDNYYLDEKGEYGVSQWSCYIEGDKKYIQELYNFFKSDKIKMLTEALTVDRSRDNFKCLHHNFYKNI